MVSDEEIFQSYHELWLQIRDVVIQHKKAKGYYGRARILHTLDKRADLSQRQLADVVSMKPGSLTEALEKMESQGLVTRKRDVHDKRIIRVAITPSGQREWAHIQQDRKSFGRQLLSSLTSEEREQAVKIATKLHQSLVDCYGENKLRKEFFDD